MDGDQQLAHEEQLAAISGVSKGIRRLVKAFDRNIADMSAKLDGLVVSGKLEVNTEKSVEVGNLESIRDWLKDLDKSLGEAITKAVRDNKAPESITVKNIGDAKANSVSVSNVGELSNLIVKSLAPVIESVRNVQPIVKVTKQDIVFPTSAKDAIAVRLSDGKSFYNAIAAAVSSGGAMPFKDSTGRGVQVALVGGSVPVVNPDGSNIGGSSSTGNITDGVDTAIKATVKDLSNSNPLATQIMDANGDAIISFGGGTQYTDGDADATPTGTVALGFDGTNVQALATDSSGNLQVDILSMPAGGSGLTDAELRASDVKVTLDGESVPVTGTFWQATQPVSGTVTANLSATDSAVLDAIEADTTTLAGAVSGTEMQVDVLTMPTVTVTATNLDVQSGGADLATSAQAAAIQTAVETIDNAISGSEMQVDVVTSALPSGASTSAKQDTMIGHLDGLEGLLTTIDGDTGNLSTIETNTDFGTVTGGGTETGALRVTIANNSTGVLSIDDNGGAITVDGTVTANLSATDNAVLDNIDADLTTIIGHVDGLEGLLTTIDADTGSIMTAVQLIDNAISGSEMQVDVVGALPAGTNAIGKLAANSGVDIGDVDVTSAVSATLDHGSNRDVDTTAEQITSTSFACKFGVTLKADATNTGIIYIGNSDVTAGTTAATDGFPLAAGDTLTLEVTNSNIPYAIASANNQVIYWVAV